jgi:1,4-alpha-glucan branching enzyme
MPRGGLWRVRFNSDSDLYSADFGNHAAFDAEAQSPGADGMSYRLPVGLGPCSAVILSQ